MIVLFGGGGGSDRGWGRERRNNGHQAPLCGTAFPGVEEVHMYKKYERTEDYRRDVGQGVRDGGLGRGEGEEGNKSNTH